MQHIFYPPSGSASAGGATEATLSALSAKLPMYFYSSLNSTATPLGSGASFTGTGEDVSKFGVISVAVYSNVASVALGLEFQFSRDNVNWYATDSYLYSSVGNVKNYSFAPVLKYFRVHYTNDGSAQSTFFIETSYKQTYVKPSSHRIGDTISAEDDSELVTAQIVGYSTAGGGGYKNVKVNPSGALTTETTISDVSALVGQKTMSASLPVVIASNQTSFPVSQADSIYIINIDSSVAGTTYYGWAAAGSSDASAVWKIWKMTDSAGIVTLRKADGDDLFNNIWNNRASLTFS